MTRVQPFPGERSSRALGANRVRRKPSPARARPLTRAAGLVPAITIRQAARHGSRLPGLGPMPKPAIRVATFAGPGAKPVIETVPWPAVPANAALIKIGACGVCGTDQHILKGHWLKPLPWPFTL